MSSVKHTRETVATSDPTEAAGIGKNTRASSPAKNSAMQAVQFQKSTLRTLTQRASSAMEMAAKTRFARLM